MLDDSELTVPTPDDLRGGVPSAQGIDEDTPIPDSARRLAERTGVMDMIRERRDSTSDE